MIAKSLEIEKLNEKELRYKIDDESWVGSSSVFYAKSVHRSKPSIKFIDYTSTVCIIVELINLKVNGQKFTDAAEALSAINEFAGSFKKSGGTVNTYTKQESDAKFADKETTELNLSHKADLVNGIVPASQLPGVVDDIIEVNTYSLLPSSGESNKIYITLDNNKQFRWSGTVYVEISASLALGESSSTAHRGDHGKHAFDHSHTTGNPHNTNSDQINETSSRVFVTPEQKTNLGTAYTHSQSSGNPHDTEISDIEGLEERLTQIESDIDNAESSANSALSVSAQAQMDADNAVSVANAASSISGTAQSTANAANSTANTASTTSGNAVTTANSALSSASAALTTANSAASLAGTALQPVFTQVTNSTASISVTSSETAIPSLSITVATAGKYRIAVNANFIASELILSLLGTLNFSNTQSLANLKIKKGSTVLIDSALNISRTGLRNVFTTSVVADLIVNDVITVTVQGTIPAGTLTLVSGTGYNTILNIEKII